jgi:hypothetical protein
LTGFLRKLYSQLVDPILTFFGFRDNTNQELMLFALMLWIGIFALLYCLIFAPNFLFGLL